MIGLLVISALVSCGKESSCFKGSGDSIVEERAIPASIVEVVLSDNIDLVITQNSKASLTLQGGENLLPFIESDINNTKLELSSGNKCGFLRDYNKPLVAYLSIPNLEQLTIKGQGDVVSTNTLNFDLFKLESDNATGSVSLTLNSNRIELKQHAGPADITLSGTTNYLYAYTGGNGWITLDQISANDVHVNHDGTGDLSVYAIASLLIELTSIGNIDYYGSPIVTVSNHSGKGEIRRK